MNRLPFVVVLLLLLVLGACRPAAPEAGPSYDVRGRVVALRDGGRTLVVDHEAIPGLMPAMVMPFTVADAAATRGLAPGDGVAFRLVASGDAFRAEDLRRTAAARVPVEAAAADAFDAAPASGRSLHRLDAVWTDTRGRHVRLADFGGGPVLLSMIYTRCGYACPTIVSDMRRIAAAMPEAERARVRYVLVSMDPAHDTPAVLADYARSHGLDPDRWTLLHGTDADVRLLAMLLGLRYRQEADGQFSHTNLVAVLDARGEIAHRSLGLGVDPAPTATLLARLAAE